MELVSKAICVSSNSKYFEEGNLYPVTDTNNGMHILSINKCGNIIDFVCHTWSVSDDDRERLGIDNINVPVGIESTCKQLETLCCRSNVAFVIGCEETLKGVSDILKEKGEKYQELLFIAENTFKYRG